MTDKLTDAQYADAFRKWADMPPTELTLWVRLCRDTEMYQIWVDEPTVYASHMFSVPFEGSRVRNIAEWAQLRSQLVYDAIVDAGYDHTVPYKVRDETGMVGMFGSSTP